jgi:hypothetical protein
MDRYAVFNYVISLRVRLAQRLSDEECPYGLQAAERTGGTIISSLPLRDTAQAIIGGTAYGAFREGACRTTMKF